MLLSTWTMFNPYQIDVRSCTKRTIPEKSSRHLAAGGTCGLCPIKSLAGILERGQSHV